MPDPLTPGLRTQFDPKPIPIRVFDWDAWIDGDEELGTGHGPTEAAAIRDLSDMLENLGA